MYEVLHCNDNLAYFKKSNKVIPILWISRMFKMMPLPSAYPTPGPDQGTPHRLDSVSMLNVRTELRGRGPSRVSHLLRSAYKLFLISLTNIFPRQACTASPTSTRRRCRCCRRPRWPGSGVLWARTNPSPSLCSAELPFCRSWGGKKARKKSHLGMNHIHVNRSLHLENLFTHSVVFIFFQLPLLLQCWLEYEDCS